MERDDADQEAGRTLPNRTWIQMVAREEAERAILLHIGRCQFVQSDIEPRLRVVELSLSKLIGFMLGSGMLGGATGAMVTHFVH